MEITYSIGRVLLLTYLFLMSSYSSNLFSNSLKTHLEESRVAQHLILLILIITLLIMFGNPINYEVSKNEIFNSIIVGFVIYVFFILTTKLNYMYNISIILILVIYFLYESHKLTEYKNVINDDNLEDEQKKGLINNFNNINNYLLASILGITIFGTIMYYNEKKVKYIQIGGNNNFSLEKFWFH